MIREALEDVGVPAVINGAGSVFGTEPARQWLRLLEALERPASITRAHSAALTAFVGWPAERLAGADDDSWEWEEVHRRLHEWARVLRDPGRGVAAGDRHARRPRGRPGRARAGRLHRRAQPHRPAPRRTAAARRRLRGAARPHRAHRVAAHPRRRGRGRHRRRGAQPPAGIGCRGGAGPHHPPQQGPGVPRRLPPFLWEAGYIPDKPPRPVFFHDPEADDERTIDVALEGGDFARHKEQFIREQRGEDLRLAYVALTRARHQAVVWWAGSFDSRDSPLGRLLFARDRQRRRGAQRRLDPVRPGGRQPFRALADATGGPGTHQRRALPHGRGGGWRAERTPAAGWPWRRSSATSTCAGGAPPTATSPPPATRSG